MEKIKRIVNIYKRSGYKAVVNKIGKKLGWETCQQVKSYLDLEEPCFIKPDKEKISVFKDKYKGERCFIIGNGPSLNQVDLSLLDNECTFGVNGIFYKTKELGFSPTFYMVEDSFVMQDNLKEINSYYGKEQRFFPVDYKHLIKNHQKTCFFKMNKGFYIDESPNFQRPRFSTDFAEKGFCGQSVTILNLQLAYYMGFSEVYLIGMDFSYQIPKSAKVEGVNIESTEDDENHFHPEYFGKGKRWHDPQLDQVLKNYEMAMMIYKGDGRKIYNATVGGNLNLFERVKFEDLF